MTEDALINELMQRFQLLSMEKAMLEIKQKRSKYTREDADYSLQGYTLEEIKVAIDETKKCLSCLLEIRLNKKPEKMRWM
ncbi:MAG: hypothetical protein GWN62_12945 [Aliifodinibius sp.]|nr:hypothetical protein [Fodinibius sp.]